MTKYIVFLFFVFALVSSAQDIGYKYNPTTKLGWDYLNPKIDSVTIGLNGNLSGVTTLNDALNLIDDLSGSFGEGSLGTLTTTQNLWDGSSASLSLIARLSGASDPTFVFSDGNVNLTVGGFQIAGSNVLTIASAPTASIFTGFTGNLLGVTTLQGFADAFDNFTAGGTGTVTSVGMSVPGFMSVAGSPITTSGTLAVSLTSQIANTVFAGPTTGSATPTFRSLIDSDIPDALTRDAEAAAAYSAIGHNHDGTYQPDDVDLDSVSAGITGVVQGLGNGLGYQVAGNSAVLLATTASFLTADETKLDGIEAGATADQTDTEIETAYNNRVAIVSQIDAEAGTSTTVGRWTPQRVSQAIAALAPGGTDDQTATEVPFAPTGNIAATDTQSAIVELDTEKQAADADLTDLADGSLTGTKVGFADTDSNFAATNIQAAIEELDDVNGSGPNAADGKVAWSQIVNMPSGFSDGTDDGTGGGSGTMSTIQEDGIAVGDPDIVTLNFATGFDLLESPDTKISISLDAAEMESSLEGVLDLQDLQGAVTDAQVPDGITITLANTATTLATPRTIGNVSFNGSANIVPETIAVVDSTDATSSVAIFDSTTGDLQPKTDAGITYNASTGALSATSVLSGGTAVSVSGHTHDTATISGIDISDDTNLAGDPEVVLTGDALSLAATITRDTELASVGTLANVISAAGFNGNLATTDDTLQEVAQKLDDLSFSGSFGETSLSTLVNNQTLWDSASASRTFTIGLSGTTDPVWSFSDGVANLSTGQLQEAGSPVIVQADVPGGDLGGTYAAPTVTDDSHAHTAATLTGVAPSGATYITQTADGTLSGEQALGSLATGILKNTTTTGVLSIAVAGDFPILNQSTTGSAATLTTPRAIYGNNFDGSAALTQVIGSVYGGTGNGFTAFTGPTTTEKIFTLPNSSATLLYSGGALGTPSSGTLTNATGLPISTGVSGLGTGVATLLGTFTLANFDTAAGLTGTADATTFLRGDGAWVTPSGGGDVTAALAFGTDNVLIRSDGTGKGVQSTGITVDDSNVMTVPTVNVSGTFGINDSDDSHQYTFVPGNLSAAATITLGAGNISLPVGTLVADSRTVTVSGTANEITSSAGAQDLSTDRTWTLSLPATIDLGGKTSFEIPNGATPAVDAFGEIAADNDLWAASRGAPVFFDGTAAVGLVGALVSDAPSNGQVPTWNTGGTITWETPGTGGAPTAADYLVGTADGTLSNEIVVGTSPGGELGGTWASPTIDDTLAVTNWTLTTPTISGAVIFPDGTRQTFNPDATNAGLNVGSQAGDPSTPSNGDLWYDSTANEMTARINGANVALGAGGSFDIDALTEATEADLGDADLLGVSDGGTEKKITLVNFVDYLESLTISLATLSVNAFEVLDNVDQSHGLSFVANEDLAGDIQLQLDLDGATRTLNITGNSVLSGTNTGDQTITLTGEVTGSGTGSFATTIADSVTVTGWELGASTATTPAANDNDTSLATTAAVQMELTAYASDTVTFTNKTFDASATGNVAKRSDYIYLITPHLDQGTNATINTTSTSITYGHATFANDVDQATNYVEYIIPVPEKLDTAVVPRAKLKILLGNTDTGTQRFVLSSVSVADSAVPGSATLANAANIDFDLAALGGATGEVFTSAWVNLTGWNSALTAGQTWRIRLARDGDTSDTSTVNSTELSLVIEYGETQ